VRGSRWPRSRWSFTIKFGIKRKNSGVSIAAKANIGPPEYRPSIPAAKARVLIRRRAQQKRHKLAPIDTIQRGGQASIQPVTSMMRITA